MSSAGDVYFISAGELSGDLLAADFVKEFRRLRPNARAFGIAGENMRRADVAPIVKMEELSVMGVWDVVKRLPDFKQTESYLLAKIDQMKPKFAILVDFPGLHFRLAEQIRVRGIPVYQYVAPKLWAWGEKRITALKRDFAGVMGVLPFEEQFFLERGVKYTFVGSPHLDRVSKIMVKRESFGFTEASKIVALLPGSRVSELKFMLPRLLEIKDELKKQHRSDQLVFVMPLAKSISDEEFASVCSGGKRFESISGVLWDYDGVQVFRGMSLELMALADVAIVTSGTATLECALLDTPMVVVYVTSEGQYELAMSVIKVPYVSLVNLIRGKKVVDEFLQNFNSAEVASSVERLLMDETTRQKFFDEVSEIRRSMSGGAAASAAYLVFDETSSVWTERGK